MKYIFIFFLIFCSTDSIGYSQILNGGFEDWTGNKPNNWFVDDQLINVSRDTNSHSGKYSLHFEELGNDQNVFLSNNPRPKNYDNYGGSRIPLGNFYLTFWYKAQIADPLGYIIASVGISHNGIAGNSLRQPSVGNESLWSKVTFPLQISSTDSTSEDSVAISFWMFPSGPFTFDIDDVNLEPIPNIVSPIIQNNYPVISIIPDPILSHANLNYHINGYRSISISIFDLTGREVMKLPSLQSASGDGSIPFDVDGLPNGLYYLRFNAGVRVMMRKIIIQH